MRKVKPTKWWWNPAETSDAQGYCDTSCSSGDFPEADFWPASLRHRE
jgi:hypothetical protein